MRLENATYLCDAGRRPILEVFLDGKPARIAYPQRHLGRHWVCLGGEWQRDLEPLVLPANKRDDRGELELRGYLEDKRLAEMVRRFRFLVDNGKFAPGPAEIPPREVKY